MRISDWSSDVCSSDLPTVTPTSLLAGGRNEEREDREDQPSKNQSPSKNFVASANPLVSERSEEHTSELQSLMRISYAVFCLKKKKMNNKHDTHTKNTTQCTPSNKSHTTTNKGT